MSSEPYDRQGIIYRKPGDPINIYTIQYSRYLLVHLIRYIIITISLFTNLYPYFMFPIITRNIGCFQVIQVLVQILYFFMGFDFQNSFCLHRLQGLVINFTLYCMK